MKKIIFEYKLNLISMLLLTFPIALCRLIVEYGFSLDDSTLFRPEELNQARLEYQDPYNSKSAELLAEWYTSDMINNFPKEAKHLGIGLNFALQALSESKPFPVTQMKQALLKEQLAFTMPIEENPSYMLEILLFGGAFGSFPFATQNSLIFLVRRNYTFTGGVFRFAQELTRLTSFLSVQINRLMFNIIHEKNKQKGYDSRSLLGEDDSEASSKKSPNTFEKYRIANNAINFFLEGKKEASRARCCQYAAGCSMLMLTDFEYEFLQEHCVYVEDPIIIGQLISLKSKIITLIENHLSKVKETQQHIIEEFKKCESLKEFSHTFRNQSTIFSDSYSTDKHLAYRIRKHIQGVGDFVPSVEICPPGSGFISF